MRRSIVFVALLASCAESPAPPPRPVEPAPPPPASSIVSAPPPPVAASAPVASASAPAPSAPPPQEKSPCFGTDLDLGKLLRDATCTEHPVEPPPKATSLRVRIEPEKPSVGSDAWLDLKLVIENGGDEPAVLRIPAMGGGLGLGGLGADLGGAFGTIGHAEGGGLGRASPAKKPTRASTEPPPEPTPYATEGTWAHPYTTSGRDLDDPGAGVFGMIGVLGASPPEARVTVAPHGRAFAIVHWLARGYLPGKKYLVQPKGAPDAAMAILPKDPLPPGEIDLEVGLDTKDDAVPTAKVRVRIAKGGR